MVRGSKLAAGAGLALCVLAAGCGAIQVTNLLNPDFLTALGLGTPVATLPGVAPGLLVAVENRVDHPIVMVVSYRDQNDNVQSYTNTLAVGGTSATMLVCPVSEITLGDVSNLNQSGARVYLTSAPPDPNSLGGAAFIDVEPFASLLREGINYDCGDGLTFTVQTSTATRSGFQTFAFIRRSGS